MTSNKGQVSLRKVLNAKKSEKTVKPLNLKAKKIVANTMKQFAIIKSKKGNVAAINTLKSMKKISEGGKKTKGMSKALKKSKMGKSSKSRKTLKKKTKRKAPAALIRVMNVSDNLASIIGQKKASRPQCANLQWAKKHNLQDAQQRQYFTPDEKMAKVFGKKKMKCILMSKYLSANLSD